MRKRIIAAFVITCLSLTGIALAVPPDLTDGGVPDSTQTQNLGATGMRGWAYREKNSGEPTAQSRQIQVQVIDPGSPTDGIMATNDVIIGADGTGATPTLFTSDARKSLAYAIQDAEANNPAELKLLVWRGAGVTNVETITLQTMGAYSATAPYDCPKSTKILEQGIQQVYASGDAGRYNWDVMALLAYTNESYYAFVETNALALIPTAEEMDWMLAGTAQPNESKPGWARGYELILQAEYFLATGDTNVLPSIEARSVEIARRHSLFGTMGHIFAEKNIDGSDNGPMGGTYGVINTPSLNCLLGMLLARECGVTNQYISAGIERASRFYSFYAGKSGIPYGEHPPVLSSRHGGSNGKNAVAALAFALQTNRVEECQFYSKMCAASSEDRETGHTGPFFNYMWVPLGANVGGTNAVASLFSRISWHLDLQRRWDGTFAYDDLAGDSGNGNDYADFSMTAGMLLTYALPYRRLYITGANQSPEQILSASDVTEVQAAEDYDPTTRSFNELLSDLDSWSPVQMHRAAGEIGNRSLSSAEVDEVLALAMDVGTNVIVRAGACDALRYIDDTNTLDEVAALLTDSEDFVRIIAAEGLRYMTDRVTQLDTVLAAAATVGRPLLPFDEEDPCHFDHGRICFLLFYSGSASGIRGIVPLELGAISGIDTNLLYPAIRAVAATPTGYARSTLQYVYDRMTYEDMLAVAGSVVDSIHIRAPADKMFSTGVRIAGLELLERNGIAEGIPLSPILVEDDSTSNAGRNGILTLEHYAGACLNVMPDPGIIPYLESHIGGPPPYPYGGYKTEAEAALLAITNDASPYVPTPFKSISSVSADDNPVTLSGSTVSTTLRVDAFDYADGDSIFTWRKIHGASPLDITPNGTAGSTNATVVFDTPGLHRFEVTMSDSLGFTEVSTQIVVTVYNSGGILPPNDPPTADPQAVVVTQDTDQPITLTGTDPEGYELVFAIATPPTHGTIVGTGSNIIYRPAPYYAGPDSFTFSVTDSEAQTDTAEVTVSVRAASYNGLRGELGVLDLSAANGGINPATGAPWAIGDEYRLAFVTHEGTDTTSTNISTYNTFVQDAANGVGLGGTWKIIGSTADVDARDNTMTNPNTNGVGVGIFLLDGVTKVADSNNDLWDASLDAPIEIDVTRTVVTSFATIPTGSDTDGTGRNEGEPDDRVLGGSTNEVPPKVTTGTCTQSDGGWIAVYNTSHTSVMRVYALSDPLQILSNDTNAPTLSSVVPLNGSTAVALDTDLTATFDEVVLVGSGSITITNLTDATAMMINVTNVAAVSVSNEVLTINPLVDLERGDVYAVLIPWGAITDASLNSFEGIADTATWSFTTTNPLPEVLYAPTAATYPESMGTATGTVVLTHDYNAPVTVEHLLATPAGTATAGDDYTYVSDTLVFNPGETSKSFTFSVDDDTENESAETIIFGFGTVGNATPAAASNFTYTIEADTLDIQPTVTFAVTNAAGPESAASVTGTVYLSKTYSGTVIVEPAVSVGSTATAGDDYIYASTSLVFSAGETNKSFAFTVINDTDEEPAETVVFEFSSISNGVAGVESNFTYTIQSDPLDTPPTVTFAPVSALGPESASSVTGTVVLSHIYSGTVTVDPTVAAGSTATAGDDYIYSPVSLVFNTGETNKSFAFTVIDDTDDEPAETVVFAFGSIANGVAGVASNFTYTIEADSADVPPTVSFAAAAAGAPESAMVVTGAVVLSHIYSGSVTVDQVVLAGGTATAGDDFTYTPIGLTFNPGETSREFTFTVMDDSVDEESETVIFTLSGITGGVSGSPDTFVYTIQPDPSDWYSIPFYEPFEDRTLGDLGGQHGWVADDAVAQDSITYGGSAQAGAITNEGGSLSHTFSDGRTKVWTDMRIQVIHSPELPVPPGDSTVYIYVSTNSQVMAFDGTNAVAVGRTVAEGQWIQVTCFSDYTTATWDLFIDGVAAGRYAFYNAGVPSFGECLIEGDSTYIDDISITLNAPYLKGVTTVILVK